MAIYRQIHISFWQDPFVLDLTPEEKYFYLYLMTNSKTSQCGIYEIPKKVMELETGYNRETIDKLMQRFTDYKKILYDDATREVFLVNWRKHNENNSPRVKKRVEKELTEVKSKALLDGYAYGINTVSIPNCNNNQNQNNNHNQNKQQIKEIETVVVVDSDEWNQINKQYVECFGSVLTPNNVKMLESYLSDGLTIWHIQEALKITLENKGKSIKYTQGVLNTWLSKKAFTRSDVEAINQSYVKPTKTTQVFGDEYKYEQREKPAAGAIDWLDDDEEESE